MKLSHTALFVNVPTNRVRLRPLLTAFFTMGLLYAGVGSAQAPEVGYVENVPDWGAGYALTRVQDQDTRRYIVYAPHPGIDETYVNIDARDVLVHEISRDIRSATNPEGEAHDYDVLVLRPEDDAFELELWLRYESDGFEGQTIFGGMIVRKNAEQTVLQVAGHAGP